MKKVLHTTDYKTMQDAFDRSIKYTWKYIVVVMLVFAWNK